MATKFKPFEATVGITAAKLTSGDTEKDAFVFERLLIQFDDGASTNGNTGIISLSFTPEGSDVTVTGSSGGLILRPGDWIEVNDVALGSIYAIASAAGQKLRVTPLTGLPRVRSWN